MKALDEIVDAEFEVVYAHPSPEWENHNKAILEHTIMRRIDSQQASVVMESWPEQKHLLPQKRDLHTRVLAAMKVRSMLNGNASEPCA